jgi:hypothetical protein
LQQKISFVCLFQAQDAEDERQALLAERRLSALADEAERRIAMNADHGVLGRTITEQGAYAQMTYVFSFLISRLFSPYGLLNFVFV